MALVVPLASSASVIENILFKVRRGIAMSRNATQTDPATGVMVDLPEKIDFEMTLLKVHQGLERKTDTLSSDNSTEFTSASKHDNSLSGKSFYSNKISLNSSLVSTSETNTGSDTALSRRSSAETSNESKVENDSVRGSDFDVTIEIGKETGSENGLDVGSQNENTKETENNSNKGGDSFSQSSKSSGQNSTGENGAGKEGRCTNQVHTANREYSKFDTDTGEITGISI